AETSDSAGSTSTRFGHRLSLTGTGGRGAGTEAIVSVPSETLARPNEGAGRGWVASEKQRGAAREERALLYREPAGPADNHNRHGRADSVTTSPRRRRC